MQLYTDQHKDVRLLDLRGLTPLDIDVVAGDLDLRAMIQGHNARCARATARLRHLADDRRRLGDFNAWERQDSATLLAERARLRGATWDALRELRHALEEREHVLTEIEQRLQERYFTADQEHDRAVAAAEQRLAKERRTLQRVNPSRAESHFRDLVTAEESVREATERNTEARRALESAAEARRSIAADVRAVTARQREVFAAMVE